MAKAGVQVWGLKLVYGVFTNVCFFFLVIGVEYLDQLSDIAYEPE